MKILNCQQAVKNLMKIFLIIFFSAILLTSTLAINHASFGYGGGGGGGGKEPDPRVCGEKLCSEIPGGRVAWETRNESIEQDYGISKFYGKGPVDESDPNWPGKIIRTAIKGDVGVVIAATHEGIKLVRFDITNTLQCQDAQNSICIEAKVYALKNTEHPEVGDEMKISLDLDTNTQVISMVSGIMEGTNTIIHLKKIVLENQIDSFEECIAAGNPAMESYPRQCRTSDGKHFVETISAQKTCENEGGLWGFWSNNPSVTETCNAATSDEGKECTDSSQCQSYCQAGDEFEGTGMCYGYERAICMKEVTNGSQREWCE